MRFIKFGFCSLAISGLFLGLNQASASAFTLDFFTDANDEPFPGEPLQKVTVNRIDGLSGFDLDTGLSGTDLGQRRLDISLPTGSRGEGVIEVDGFDQLASISSDAKADLSSAKFTWGSDSTTPQDITSDGSTSGAHDSFLVDVVTVDLSGATFTFSVEDDGNDVGSISQPVNSTGDIYFPYETLTTNFPNVDQTRIREVSLEVTSAPPNFDASFNFIRSATQPVPFEFSPSLGLVVCGGLFGINKLKKRFKNA